MKVSRRSLLSLVVLVLAVSVANRWWVDRHDDAQGAAIAALAQPGDLRMISSENCVICLEARSWLLRNEVKFSECLIERDAACRADYDALGAQGTPVFVVRGQPQLGFNVERLRVALARTG
jgi:hypothetical protein